MPETATKAAASLAHQSSFVKSSAPGSTPARVSSTWPAVSQAVPPTVQLRPNITTVPQSSGGEPLQPHIQRSLEGSFGVDLRSVRIHSDIQSQDTVRNLSTRAFTFGNNIFLGPGERTTDLRLIAHEASHVV